MEQMHDMVRKMSDLWFDMYESGQGLFTFFTTPVKDQVTEGDDFLGVLSSIDETPFELILTVGLIGILMMWLLKFFKIV